MDMWTDLNLSPFIAVMVHWIEPTMETADGPQDILKLQADLIGFHCIPGQHDG